MLITSICCAASFHAGAMHHELLDASSPDAAPRSAQRSNDSRRQRSADRHARQMEAAFTAARARVARIDLAACDFDTRSPSGLALPFLGSQLPDAVHVRTLSAGSFEASHQTPGRPARVGETRSCRLERCARHRTLCRQIDDELSARARRRADAADLDYGIGAGRARPR